MLAASISAGSAAAADMRLSAAQSASQNIRTALAWFERPAALALDPDTRHFEHLADWYLRSHQSYLS